MSSSWWSHELYSLSDSSAHGILQARVLAWVAFPFSRESSQPRDWTQVSRIVGRFFTSWVESRIYKMYKEHKYIYILFYYIYYLYLDAEKDWGWEEKGMTEDEMVGWHHWLDRHEFEQAPGVGDGQGSLVCCSPWGRKESDMTEWLNWTELIIYTYIYIYIFFFILVYQRKLNIVTCAL